VTNKPVFKSFKLSKLIIARFTFGRTTRLAAIWGLAFGLSSLSSITGFQTLYKKPAARANLVQSFGHNPGLNALFGQPSKLDTAAGFTTWRIVGLAMLIGSIWGLLTATKNLRGEEEAGRWEIFLSGQTTAKQAVANSLIGMILGLLPLVIIPAILTYAAGRANHLGYSLSASLFYGLTLAASAALFLTVGSVASQLGSIRRRAALYSALFFGASFLVRAAGDADSSLHWLTKISPLGWVENLRPLTASDPKWLVPVVAFWLFGSLAAVLLAGRRDLGASLIADHDTAKARTGLLNNSLGLSLRLEKSAIIGWMLGAGFVGLLYGYISKSAADVFKNSTGASKVVGKIAGQTQVKGVETFLGVVFLLLMVVIMIEVTALVGAMRSQEADGQLDNLLVRRVSRLGWLGGRVLIASLSLVLSAALGTALAWLAIKSQHLDVGFHKLFLAGLNVLPAIIFTAGFGILVLGVRPRLTTTFMYALIAWSFLMEMVGSAINLNHYVLDTSIFHHVALAPAVNPNWHSDIILLAFGIMMVLLGMLEFNHRDLQAE
jgi:ABC-2 type transport system permease protein